MLRRTLTFVVALLLAGCATTPMVLRLTDGDNQRVVRELPIDPVMFAGLPWNDTLARGNYFAVLGTFPETQAALAEWDPLRVRHQAYASGADGTEYVAHALFAGFIACVPRYIILIEGLTRPETGVKVVTLSTLVDRAYTAQGEEIAGFKAGDFQSSASYRREFTQASGSEVTMLRPVPDMAQAIAGWSLYDTKLGRLATPLDPEQVKQLASINTQYQYWDKVQGTARGALSLDYVGTALGVAFDLIDAREAPSRGFDHQSLISRAKLGYNWAVWAALRTHGSQSCQVASRRAS